MVRILRVVPIFHPPESMYGHSVTFYMISEAQVSAGNKVRVLSPRKSNGQYEINGIDVSYMEHNPKFLSFFGFQKKLEKEIVSTSKDIDIIHSHGKVALGLRSESIGLPHIVHLHDTPFALEQSLSHKFANPRSFLYDFRKKLLYSRYLKRATAIIAYSQYVRNHAIRTYNIQPDKISVISNGISSHFNPNAKALAADELGIPSHSRIVLYVGRIVSVRGIFEAVQAFHLLQKEEPDTHLLIIGNSSSVGTLRLDRLIQELGLNEKVTHVDHVAYTKLPSYYKMASLHIAVGSYRGYPKTIMESLACGTPVIANRNEDVLSLLDTDDGLVNGGNPQLVSNTMRTVLSSDRISSDVKSTADHNSKRFSWRVTAEKISEIYNEAMNGRAPS